jgi:hypothetical protein
VKLPIGVTVNLTDANAEISVSDGADILPRDREHVLAADAILSFWAMVRVAIPSTL